MKLLWATIYVKNLEESITFYSDLLGLKVIRKFTAGPTIEIAFMGNGTDNETQVELMADQSTHVSHSESMVLGFAVSSIHEMLDTVQSKKIAVLNGPFETPASRFFTIKDPNGLNVQFFQQK